MAQNTAKGDCSKRSTIQYSAIKPKREFKDNTVEVEEDASKSEGLNFNREKRLVLVQKRSQLYNY